jgi:hypothetical protein
MKLRITTPPGRAELFPAEIFELIELVMAGCPEEPLKVFRKTLIGRGKPLSARQADSAISGARCVLQTGPKADRGKRAERPETMPYSLARMRWYLRHRMPVVFARPQGHTWDDPETEVIGQARAAGVPVTFLEWDTAAVDRTAGPGCLPR